MFYKQKKLLPLPKVNGVYTKKSPITALRNHNGKVSVYTDEEAGSKIKEINKKF